MSMFSMAAADGCLADGRAKSFRPPAEAESLSLCVAKEKVTQEKGHPACAPCGHPGLHSVMKPKSNSNSEASPGRCFARAPALLKSAGQDGPLLHPGPLCGGASGTTGRAAGIDRDVDAFSHGKDARSKSPAPARGLAGQEPGKRQAGWPSLLVTFLLATQEKSDSVAAGDRKLFALKQAKAPALKSLLQMSERTEALCSDATSLGKGIAGAIA